MTGDPGLVGRTRHDRSHPRRVAAANLARLAGCALLAAGLVAAVLALPAEPTGLQPVVEPAMAESGVTHPVTAVLLAFRAWDTWLELAVLLLAAVLLLGLRRATDLTGVERLPPASDVLVTAVRLVVPLIVLTAVYVLWLGTHSPGGAFQAGAVLGAGGVLLREAGLRGPAAIPGGWLRVAFGAGFLGLTVAGTLPLLVGLRPFELPADLAGSVIVAVELAAGASIGLTLAAMFAASQTRLHPGPDAGREGGNEGGEEVDRR